MARATASAANNAAASRDTADKAGAPAIYISAREDEASVETHALQRALSAHAVTSFVCDIPQWEDFEGASRAALRDCEMVVILGTAGYGCKRADGPGTFEELRTILQTKKPFFLAKMCDAFEVAETLFRLPSTISYFPWPSIDVIHEERRMLPMGLVAQVLQRLKAIQTAADTSAERQTGENGDALDGSPRIAEWLASSKLVEFEGALRNLGTFTLLQVHAGFETGHLTIAALEAQGFKRLRIVRLRRDASEQVRETQRWV